MKFINNAGDAEALACLVIDDPRLCPTYGCLNYERLLSEMNEHNYYTEIAFIPWNFRRSHPKTIRVLCEHPERFAICVHGCNHTQYEFGAGSIDKLRCLAQTAIWRMEEHKRETGLSYEPVMVFPQNRFSSDAVKVLKELGYVAAFASRLQATDSSVPIAIDSRESATLKYHGFPLFFRRHYLDRDGLARDLAAGHPIIIADHHDLFKSGYKPIADVVDWLNSQRRLRWTSLSEIAEFYHGAYDAVALADTRVRRFSGDSNASVSVAVRRFLCEFRDKHIQTNDILSNVYRRLRR